jgi:glycosyltransferase involved in cell wall biosynthesis
MPTRDRTAYVWQSIRYFERQSYPVRELIILDDGAEDLSHQIPHDRRIRYVRLPRGQSIGAKRNLGCELAQGSIIAQWDDDDWYAPGRLGAQVAPLLSGEADISALTAGVFFDLPAWQFWSCTPELHQRLFVHDVHGGTLVYQRRIWAQLARYPDASLGEDAAFLRRAIRLGARLCRLPNANLFIYVRHAKNAWSFLPGQHLERQGWHRVAEPMLPTADRPFYAALSPVAPPTAQSSSSLQHVSAQPLVSCIMPTANRRLFVPQAIHNFLKQDYPDRELIVIDDGTDTVADLIPSASSIRYMRLERKHSVGAKRNVACQEARGEIIVHWDDDDWMAHWRLSYQVASLLKQGADICGLDKVLYYDTGSGQAWQFTYPKGGRPWVAGNTLCYTKAFWRMNPFPDMNVGEDSHFLWTDRPKSVATLPNATFYVALIHPGNTSPKRPAGRLWHSYSSTEIRHLMGEDWTFYANLLQGKRRMKPEAGAVK